MPEDPRKLVQREMMRSMGRSLIRLSGGVKDYPAQRPEVNYIRTHTLGRSLTTRASSQSIHKVRRIHGGVEGRWGTNVTYARWVIDEARQTDVHRNLGKWWTLQSEAKRMMPLIRREFEAGNTRIANQLGPRWTRKIVIEIAI